MVFCNKIFFNFTVYKFLLDLCFFIYISPLWNYVHYGCYVPKPFSFIVYILSWLVLFLFNVMISKINTKSFSFLVVVFLYCISFIPFLVMLGFSVFEFDYIICNITFWFIFLVLYLVYVKGKILSINDVKDYNFNYDRLLIIIITLSLFITCYFGYMNDFKIDLNIKNVYTLRSQAKQLPIPSVLMYLMGFFRMIIPIGIVISIKEKRYYILCFFILCVLLNYSFDGGKTVLFISIVALLMGMVFKHNINIPFLSNLLMVVGFVDYLFFSNFIFLFIIRRLMFVPNLINSYVYDYMVLNSPNYFMHLTRFFGIKNTFRDINYIIGDIYFRAPLMSANSGLIAEAMWQFKYLGIVIYPIILIVTLMLLDKSTKGISKHIYFISALETAYYINNSAYFPLLFSHGLVLFMLTLFLCQRKS